MLEWHWGGHIIHGKEFTQKRIYNPFPLINENNTIIPSKFRHCGNYVNSKKQSCLHEIFMVEFKAMGKMRCNRKRWGRSG